MGIEPYESIAAAVAARHFDAAFVCTAPLTHAGIIGELLDAGLPVFTELNLVDDGYDALIAKIENGVLTVSHEKDVKFLVEINGVNVADKLDENKSLALSDVLENGTTTAKIKITAMLDGYKPSSVEIIYNAEE